MRVFLIPGFGENESIFEPLHPYLSYETIPVDIWKHLLAFSGKESDVLTFAKYLNQSLQIRPSDLVIGHSMGGWIGLHLKQESGCHLIQIASWTNPQKVILPIQNRKILYFLVRSGLYINSLTKNFLLQKFYHNLPSRSIMEATLNRLIQTDKSLVVKQLQLILEPVPSCSVTPDLRIHTRRDPIIRKPDEAFFEVSGDHFALYTHPKEVARGILSYLQR